MSAEHVWGCLACFVSLSLVFVEEVRSGSAMCADVCLICRVIWLVGDTTVYPMSIQHIHRPLAQAAELDV